MPRRTARPQPTRDVDLPALTRTCPECGAPLGAAYKTRRVVTTLETWDLTYYATGGESVISDRPDNRSRVAYQVKKEDGRWRVFHRELKQELSE